MFSAVLLSIQNFFREYVQRLDKGPVLLVIQCDSGDRHSDLIACAKYAIKDECAKVMKSSSLSILFIVQLTPMDNRCFHSIQVFALF